MKSILIKIINFISKPFAGKGIIDRYFPFVLHLYENIYSKIQPDEYVIVNIPQNLKLRVSKKDSFLGNLLINKGEFEPLETLEFIKSIQQDSTVFDVGANFGYYANIAGSIAINGKVYAFEPDKNNFEDLKFNASLNSLINIKVENLGVGSTSGYVYFKSDTVHRGRSKIVENEGDYKINIVTLDDYCQKKNILNIDILKVDVEGFETNVLEGAKNVIKKSPNIKLFIEFNPSTLKERNLEVAVFFDTLKDVGLAPKLIIDEAKGQVLEFNQKNLKHVLTHSTYSNLVCLK